MSMISELLGKLRTYAAGYNLPPFGREIEGTAELLNQAADTIEALSAKLQAAETGQPEKHDAEKLVGEMAEEIENCYGRETGLTEKARKFLADAGQPEDKETCSIGR